MSKFLHSLNPSYGDVVEFAAELGERFPDLTNYQILLACSEYAGRDISYDTVLGRVCIDAYDSGSVEAPR